jgi:NADH:ubiquinone oxidoreductase subunit 5 (subunit L)/multisubunit Na+/H+ antiporter MnhA subunit
VSTPNTLYHSAKTWLGIFCEILILMSIFVVILVAFDDQTEHNDRPHSCSVKYEAWHKHSLQLFAFLQIIYIYILVYVPKHIRVSILGRRGIKCDFVEWI